MHQKYPKPSSKSTLPTFLILSTNPTLMKLLKRLRKSATCCMPVRSCYHLNTTDHPLYSLPQVGQPRKTSTPVPISPIERYTKRSEPRSLESLTNIQPVLSSITDNAVKIPPPAQQLLQPGAVRSSAPPKPARSQKNNLKKKSDPRKNNKKTVVVPEKTDISHLLPVDELHTQPRNCDLECIVCALAKPELRTRHHCTAYNPKRM